MAKKKKNKETNPQTVTEEKVNEADESLKEEAKLAEALLNNKPLAEAENSEEKLEKGESKSEKTEKSVGKSEKTEDKSEKTEDKPEKTEDKPEKTEDKPEKTEDKPEKTEGKSEKTENKSEEAHKNSPKELAEKVDQKISQKAHEIEKAKDAKDAEKALKKLADEADSESKALVKKDKENDTKKNETEKKKTESNKTETVPDKKKYAEIMKTSSFVKAFILMLIPGINIICVLLWAIGAAKNKNKVHFTRACIILFIIEIFLTAILAGAGYIAASVKETEILKWADTKTNGLISYFEIDSYKELPKLLKTSEYLKDPEEENTTEPEVPKTCYVYNPDGIDSYDTFMKLWNAEFHKDTSETTTVATDSTTQNVSTSKGLFEILEENNVDTKESKMIYIIIDNDKESCIVAFDPTGKLQSFPKVEINNENIFIGGTK